MLNQRFGVAHILDKDSQDVVITTSKRSASLARGNYWAHSLAASSHMSSIRRTPYHFNILFILVQILMSGHVISCHEVINNDIDTTDIWISKCCNESFRVTARTSYVFNVFVCSFVLLITLQLLLQLRFSLF